MTESSRQAVIRETERMHPVIGNPFERVVPDSGAVFNGYFVPKGTIVGVTGWVTHFDKSVFGEDAELFRPERWLEADEDRVRAMNKNIVAVSTFLPEKMITVLTIHSLD